MNLFRRNRAAAEAADNNYGWQPIPPELAPPAPADSPNGSEPPASTGADVDKPAPRRRSSPRPRAAARSGKTDKELLPLLDRPDDAQASRDEADTPEKKQTTRGRGRGRRTASEAPAAQALAPDMSSLSGDNRILAELLLRQTIALENFGERQVSALREVQRSVDNLAGGIGGGATRRPRCGIFVDVPNIIYTADRMRARIDFGKLLDLLSDGRELVRASAYAPISDDPSQALETQRFVQPFVDRGYKIVTKPLKRFADGSIKANFDVELAMDILTMADRLDVVCLVSGDGDFRRLVEIVESKGVRVEVIAFGQSTAGELKTSADDYIEMGSILDRIT